MIRHAAEAAVAALMLAASFSLAEYAATLLRPLIDDLIG